VPRWDDAPLPVSPAAPPSEAAGAGAAPGACRFSGEDFPQEGEYAGGLRGGGDRAAGGAGVGAGAGAGAGAGEGTGAATGAGAGTGAVDVATPFCGEGGATTTATPTAAVDGGSGSVAGLVADMAPASSFV